MTPRGRRGCFRGGRFLVGGDGELLAVALVAALLAESVVKVDAGESRGADAGEAPVVAGSDVAALALLLVEDVADVGAGVGNAAVEGRRAAEAGLADGRAGGNGLALVKLLREGQDGREESEEVGGKHLDVFGFVCV